MSALDFLISESAGKHAEHAKMLGLPSRAEGWKYLNLRALEKGDWRAPVESDPEVTQYDVPDYKAARLVWVDGTFRGDLSDQVEGLTLAAEARPELQTPDAFVAANLGAGSGLHLTVSRNLNMAIHCLFVGTQDNAAAQPNLTWHVEAGATLEVLEQHAGPGKGLLSLVQSWNLARDAQVKRYKLLVQTGSVLAYTHAHVSQGANFDNHQLDLAGSLNRDEIRVQLAEKQAECRLNGLYWVDGRRTADSHTRIEHVVGDTQSWQHYRGIADDRGKAVFNGIVVIEKDAQRSATEQKNANLLLSDKAEINPKPELQIHADDVVASHGSTVGNLDESQLFYLRQRGIGETEARALLTFAFAEQVIEALPNAALQQFIEARVAQALPAAEVVGDEL